MGYQDLTLLKGIESLPQSRIFLIPISLKPKIVDLRYLKLRSSNLSLTYQRCKPPGCKDMDKDEKIGVCGTDLIALRKLTYLKLNFYNFFILSRFLRIVFT